VPSDEGFIYDAEMAIDDPEHGKLKRQRSYTRTGSPKRSQDHVHNGTEYSDESVLPRSYSPNDDSPSRNEVQVSQEYIAKYGLLPSEMRKAKQIPDSPTEANDSASSEDEEYEYDGDDVEEIHGEAETNEPFHTRGGRSKPFIRSRQASSSASLDGKRKRIRINRSVVVAAAAAAGAAESDVPDNVGSQQELPQPTLDLVSGNDDAGTSWFPKPKAIGPKKKGLSPGINGTGSDKKPPGKYSIWPTSPQSCQESSDSEGEGESATQRKRREERRKQSLTVSRVAEQLEICARRAARGYGVKSGGRGRGSSSAMFSPTTHFLSDTMRYNALTYDDEIIGKDSLDVCCSGASDVFFEGQNKHAGSSKTAALVTDDDGSEVSSSQASNASPATFRPSRSCMADFLDKASSMGKKQKLFPSDLMPPIQDMNIVSSVGRKLGMRGHDFSFYTGKNVRNFEEMRMEHQNFCMVSSYIATFCMSTSPKDANIAIKIKNLMNSCQPLAEEFNKYSMALCRHSGTCLHHPAYLMSGHPSFPNQHTNSVPIGRTNGHIALLDTTRDFMVFSLNYLDRIIRQFPREHTTLFMQDGFNCNFTSEEQTALKACAKAWFESSSLKP